MDGPDPEIRGLPPAAAPAPPVFGAPLAPGTVRVSRSDGTRAFVDYAIARCSDGILVVYILDLFAAGDERARAAFLVDGPGAIAPEDLRDVVDATVFVRVTAELLGWDEGLVRIPLRYGSWPLGMTQAEIADWNAGQRDAAAAAAPAPKIIVLEERRRARAAASSSCPHHDPEG